MFLPENGWDKRSACPTNGPENQIFNRFSGVQPSLTSYRKRSFVNKLNFGIAPELFQIIKRPPVLFKYMRYYINVVQQYPFAVKLALAVPGVLPGLFIYFLFN